MFQIFVQAQPKYSHFGAITTGPGDWIDVTAFTENSSVLIQITGTAHVLLEGTNDIQNPNLTVDCSEGGTTATVWWTIPREVMYLRTNIISGSGFVVFSCFARGLGEKDLVGANRIGVETVEELLLTIKDYLGNEVDNVVEIDLASPYTVSETSPGVASISKSPVNVAALCTNSPTIPDTTHTSVSFDTEIFKNAITHSGTDFTIQQAGYYGVKIFAVWPSVVSGVTSFEIFVNGSDPADVLDQQNFGATNTFLHGVCDLQLAANDVVTVNIFQTTGGDLTLSECYIALERQF